MIINRVKNFNYYFLLKSGKVHTASILNFRTSPEEFALQILPNSLAAVCESAFAPSNLCYALALKNLRSKFFVAQSGCEAPD